MKIIIEFNFTEDKTSVKIEDDEDVALEIKRFPEELDSIVSHIQDNISDAFNMRYLED